MLTEKDHINLELYLSKKLEGSEKLSFEQELRLRPELMAEAKVQRKISLGLQELAKRKETEELRSFLEDVKKELVLETKEVSFVETSNHKKTGKIISLWNQSSFRLAIAASFAAIMGVVSYLFLTNKETINDVADIKPSRKDSSWSISNPSFRVDSKKYKENTELLAMNENEKLYNQYYTDLPQFKGGLQADLVEGVNKYHQGKYKESLSILSKYEPSIGSNYSETQKDSVQNLIDNLAIYKGLCYLKLNQNAQAGIYLSTASQSNDPTINEFANWYLALNYIKTNQIDSAKIVLTEIINNEDSRFVTKANELLNKIK